MGANLSVQEIRKELELNVDIETVNRIMSNIEIIINATNKIIITGFTSIKNLDIQQQNLLRNQTIAKYIMEATSNLENAAKIKEKIDQMQDADGLFAMNADVKSFETRLKQSVSETLINETKSNIRNNFLNNNELIFDSGNVVGKGEIDGVKISQINQTYNQNLLEAYNKIASDAKLDTLNENDVKTSQKATGLNLGMMIMIAVIIGAIGLVIFLFKGGATGASASVVGTIIKYVIIIVIALVGFGIGYYAISNIK